MQYKALQGLYSRVSLFTLTYTYLASGQVPAIGPPPAALGASIAPLSVNSAVVAPQSQVMRQARRLYVGNIPFGVSEDEMVDFFNNKLLECQLNTAPGNPVLACQINLDKNFAFIEV